MATGANTILADAADEVANIFAHNSDTFQEMYGLYCDAKGIDHGDDHEAYMTGYRAFLNRAIDLAQPSL